MAILLRMAQVNAIEGLWKQGWSRRRIARELGLDRSTVRKYIDQLRPSGSKPAKRDPRQVGRSEPV